MIGIDDSNPDTLRLIPRIPDNWIGFVAKNWPAYTNNGIVKLDIVCKKSGGLVQFICHASEKIKTVVVRLPD